MLAQPFTSVKYNFEVIFAILGAELFSVVAG
jgi:hypothetical protein